MDRALVRHLLLRHIELKEKRDPHPRHQGRPASRTMLQAEQALLQVLEELGPNPDLKLCAGKARQLSDCASALQPGDQAGVVGWIARTSAGPRPSYAPMLLDPALAQAALQLEVGELSDLLHSARGAHLLQRVG